jgi:hypothetical protein
MEVEAVRLRTTDVLEEVAAVLSRPVGCTQLSAFDAEPCQGLYALRCIFFASEGDVGTVAETSRVVVGVSLVDDDLLDRAILTDVLVTTQ